MYKRLTTPAISLLAILALVGLMAGCSQDDTTPLGTTAGGDDYSQLDFAQPYGGLTATDEAVAFGDEALLSMSLAEEGDAVADPAADDPQIRDMEEMGRRPFDSNDRNRPHFTYVHLRWGMLRDMMDSVAIEPPCAVTDWTGSIHVDRGMMVVRRVIRFERPLDHIIFPRLDRQTVGLVSHTACGFDGVVLQILERPREYDAPDSLDLAPNMLHIELGGFSADLAVKDLAGMEEVYDVDDLGNQFAVTGFTLSDIEACPKGFLSGIFRRLADDRPDSVAGDENAGVRYGMFAGMWRGLDGRIGGHLRGGYGVDATGQRVFVGKYIGPRGHFRGLIRGTWEPGASADLMAAFRGQWASANGKVEGLLGGEAFAVAGTRGGFFSGRWTTLCDDEAEAVLR